MNELVHFLLADLDTVLLADLRQKQAEADAALGDGVIIAPLLLHFGAGCGGIVLVARLMIELAPDLVELGLDHRSRNREIVGGGELVEQLALHMGAGEAVQLLLDLTLEQAAQLLDALETHRFGEFVVGLDVARQLDLVDEDVEGRGAALEIVDRIILRESRR